MCGMTPNFEVIFEVPVIMGRCITAGWYCVAVKT
jgi:hypothetical protein